MKINLQEIPEEGQTFIYNQNTGELNESLKDIIGSSAHKAEFTIMPMPAGSFEMRGTIQTQTKEDCSRCGIDFPMMIEESFYELLLPEQDQPRNSSYAKPNHILETDLTGPNVVEYQGHHFNVGEYFHEVVAINRPFIPAPPEDQKGDCSLCHKQVKGKLFHYDEPFEEKKNPFESLKKMKLN